MHQQQQPVPQQSVNRQPQMPQPAAAPPATKAGATFRAMYDYTAADTDEVMRITFV